MLPSRSRWITATWIAIAAVVLVTTLAYVTTRKWRHYRDMSFHSKMVLASANTVLVDLLDAETAQRGYLLTGSPKYLEPRRVALQRITSDTTELRRLTQDNPVQQNFISQLSPLITDKLAELDSTIVLRENGNSVAAADVVLTGRGKAKMDSARSIVSEIEAEENRLLEARLGDELNWGKSILILLLMGAIVVIASLLYLKSSVVSYSEELSVTAKEMERQMGELERYARTAPSGGATT